MEKNVKGQGEALIRLAVVVACAWPLAALCYDKEDVIREPIGPDMPERPLTMAEIVAKPRRTTKPMPLPADTGAYIGTATYSLTGQMSCGGFCFTNWTPEGLSPEEVIDECVKEGVGNCLQFWQSNERLLTLCRKAKAAGLFATCIYSQATNGIAERIVEELGPAWLGYDFGERYSFSLYDSWESRGVTLTALAEHYMNRVHFHVNQLHGYGWGDVMATSANFNLDYEVAAGTEIPLTEDFAFGDNTLSSALGRGLCRQYGLPTWGTHLAHEWYSFLPYRSPYRMKTLETALYLKYMTGAKIFINESGAWNSQSNLCEDSPMSQMPIVKRKASAKIDRRRDVEPVYAEARKRFSWIDWRSPTAKKYRKVIADFTRFCREHPAPKGQPEATWALAKGNLDIGGFDYEPNYAICGAYDLARQNPNWYYGSPEQSWGVVRKAISPSPKMLFPHKNRMFSATPYGQFDVVSFAGDNVTADYLLRNYRAVMFSGWNTCSPKQYKTLCEYVKCGGRLVIGLAHLSTDDTRAYNDPTVEKLVNGGDLTDLCGFRVVGQTPRRYWATGPSMTPNSLGIAARRRFGIMALPLGKLEFLAPKESFEMLAVDDEEEDPFIVRCRNGKGEVYFMNWWAYPDNANMDNGCGAEEDGVGLVGRLYQYVAKSARGNVWITGSDFENPDDDCRWIVYAYFPDEGKIYLLNLDYERERKCVLQQFGDKELVRLKPAEFRIINSVKLKPYEKLNQDCREGDGSGLVFWKCVDEAGFTQKIEQSKED